MKPISRLRITARSEISRFSTDSRLNKYFPWVGESSNPMMAISVDLPEPDGPVLLQELNPFLFLLRLAARTFRRLESGRSVLEKLLLPAVEHRRLQSQLFTQIENWDLV